ncbi:MAG: histidine phosphatase family protein [Gammaproteobacteria bacterium]
MDKLFLLRHAKSSWANSHLSDFQRPLSNRGIQNASDLSEFLIKKNINPHCVLVSSSYRTLETLELAGKHISDEIINIKDAIYHASVETLLGLLANEENQGTLLLVGHNPAMHCLTEVLTRSHIDKFPTCALAEIELTTSWVDIRNASHTLVNFYTPKDYARSRT